MNNKKIYIIIPAYNEDLVIGRVIENLKQEGYPNILVVDDGSTDRTYEVSKNCEVEVLRHLINRGQGAALSTGLEYLREKYDPDVVVTFDADGQHQAKEIRDLILPIENEHYDIVLGSRFLNRKNEIPLLRKIILKAGILFTNVISNIRLTDTHNGFRALGRKALEKIKITQRGMEHASEIIENIRKKGLKFKEVPVTIMYTDYSMAKGQGSTQFAKIGAKVIFKKFIK